jgi:GT2 family glycosyltransferase
MRNVELPSKSNVISTGPEMRSIVSLPVSLVIPCYERADDTSDMLAALREAEFRCEIIVVDDGSPRSLEPIVRRFSDMNIQFIRLGQNRGPAVARNVGIARSQFEHVAFTDNDCLPSKDWLIQLFEAIRVAPARIAGVGGRVAAAGKDVISNYYSYHKILDPWFYRGQHYYVTTANAIFQRHVLNLVGGFDETVRAAGGEDPGLCFKLLNAGYSFGYAPQAMVTHRYKPTLRSFMRTFFRYGYGCAGQAARHYKAPTFHSNDGFAGESSE